LKATDFLELLLLGAIWGASFILIKYATPEIGIFALVEIRALGATLLLLPIVVLKRKHKELLPYWWHLLILGLLNTVIPFCLFNYGLLHIKAGLAAILNATAPMFGILIAYLYLKESIGKIGLLGVLLGFFGVVLISYQQSANAEASLLPVLAILLATFCYGVAATFLRRKLSHINPFALAGGSQFFSALALLPLALINMPSSMPSSQAMGSALILAFVCTGLAYVLYFDLIAKVGASRAMTVGYLVPLFGIAWGYLLLNESLSVPTLLGGGCILVGVMMATNMVGSLFKRSQTKPS